MADVYATIADAEHDVQERLAVVLERRASDLQQQGMLRAYLADIVMPEGAEVLDVGCGTGAVSRELARRPGIGRVVGVDPSPVFLAVAQRLSHHLSNLTLRMMTSRKLVKMCRIMPIPPLLSVPIPMWKSLVLIVKQKLSI